MSDPIIRLWRDRTIFRILLVPIFAILPLGILICLALFGVVGGQLFGGSDTAVFLFLGGIVCFGAVAVIGGLGLILYLRARSHRVLNEVFEALGLQGSRYLLSGRKYQGSFGGIQVNVYAYASGSRYNPRPIMELYVESPVGGRMGIGMETALFNVAADLLNKEELEGTGLDGVVVYADDPSWAHAILDTSGVRNTVRTLMEAVGTYELRMINYLPDAIRLQIRNYTAQGVTEDSIRRILEDLLTLAAAVDQAAPPSEIVEATRLETSARTNREAFTPIVWGLVAAMVLGLIGVAGCALLLIVVIESGGF